MKIVRNFVLLFFTFLFSVMCSNGQTIVGTYAIKNVETGKLLRIKDANSSDGTPLVAYSPVNWKCMTWDFQQIDGRTYTLRNLFTNKTFQPVEEAVKEGTPLEQMPLAENKQNQEWEFIPVSEGVYQIKLKNSDLYLTPSDPKGKTNSPIILSSKKEGILQNWTIYLQDPKM